MDLPGYAGAAFVKEVRGVEMAKKKFYAVASGKTPGIYTDWPSCASQVKGVAGAIYKSFSTEAEARAFLKNPVYSSRQKKSRFPSAGRVLPPPAEGAIIIHTDGGSINNPGPGGYGVVVDFGDVRREFSGGFRLTTNNRMELTAAIVALGAVAAVDRPVCLYSDSSYLVNGMARGWAQGWRRRGWTKSSGEPVANADLWKQLLELTAAVEVEFRWVKGHAGNPDNERCDQLAAAAAKAESQAVDEGYERGDGV